MSSPEKYVRPPYEKEIDNILFPIIHQFKEEINQIPKWREWIQKKISQEDEINALCYQLSKAEIMAKNEECTIKDTFDKELIDFDVWLSNVNVLVKDMIDGVVAHVAKYDAHL